MAFEAKIVRATRKVGSVSTGVKGIPAGVLYYWAYQKASGPRNNSGGTGRRATRFYQGRFAHRVVLRRRK